MQNNNNSTFMLFSTNSSRACDNVSFIAEIPQGTKFSEVEHEIHRLTKYDCFTVVPVGVPNGPALYLSEFYGAIKNIKLHQRVMKFRFATFEEVDLPDGVAINQTDPGVPILELMTAFRPGDTDLVDKETDILKALNKLFDGELVYTKSRAQFKLVGKTVTTGSKEYTTSYGIVGCSLVRKKSHYTGEFEEL